MRNSLMRAIMLLAIVTLTLGSSGFGQSAAQTQVVGGSGGDPFQDGSNASGARIAEVRVSSGTMVDSIQVIYILPNGRTVEGPRHGGPGGQTNSFRLDSDEYIVGISGRFGKNIDSLRIVTNKRTSPLYGGPGGRQDYRVDVPSDSQAVGFAGRSGSLLDAVGLIFAPITMQVAGQTNIAGGTGGEAFSDTQIPLGGRISEIRISSGKYIDGIQVLYTLPDGSVFEGPWHGGRGGSPDVFKLDANEYVVGLSGRCGNYIDSLIIRTNRRTSPQYGGTGGRQDFRIDVASGNQAVGLIGRAAKYLDAIGLSYASTGRQGRDYFRRRRQ
jgi:hypothetical protein